MPLSESVRSAIDAYARGDLAGDLDWHIEFFSFISDGDLRSRVGQEFFAARYLYKVWEGLRLDDAWAARAQIQLQVQQYASIYEACIHHLLFVDAASSPEVRELQTYEALVEQSLPGHIMDRIRALPSPDAGELVGSVRRTKTAEISKIRFDNKVDAAVQMKMIDASIGKDLTSFYSARNLIHIHAEMKHASSRSWEIRLSRDAYRRLRPFKAQVEAWQAQQQQNGTFPPDSKKAS